MTGVKKCLRYVGMLFGIVMGLYIIFTTPTLSESSEKLDEMNRYMDSIHENGGIILSRKEVNKYGVADLTLELPAGSLPDLVWEKDKKTLVNLGWMPLNGYENSYCKGGMIFSSKFSDEKRDGMNIIIMNFRYTSQTIGICDQNNK